MDYLFREIKCSDGPDLQRIDPSVCLARRRQRDILAEIGDRIALTRCRYAVSEERDLFSAGRCHLGVNMKLKETVSPKR